ncbi:hypothetical protein UG55_108811 [Frankia sp. EI5c]|uniref:hypothetical protein n=1 Tax=Frankia sp. EI5c TaxID=683316 RepID=UPI0007C408AB|nr:hypothetical protein [Frankia sp. EI5c]OAA19607.1 hypothetical protein UG55_108811 [Frankia sp. EI5c]
MATRDTDALPLRQVSAQIYRQNPFRLTGLPLSATARDIRRKADMLAVLEKTGGQLPEPAVLPRRPAPSPEELRAALERLGDPRRRVVDEFFWFWPAGPDSGQAGPADGQDRPGESRDEALTALAAGDPLAAARLWATVTGSGEDQVPVADAANAKHNLAVLVHLRALDAELGPDVEPVPDAARIPDAEPPPGTGPPDWGYVYRRWGDVLRDDQVWDNLEARIRQTADARLDPGLAASIRAGLPTAVLSIGAELAVAAIAAGEDERAGRQLAAMREAQLGDGAALDTALRLAGAPWTDEIDRLCDSARQVAEGARLEGLTQAEHILTESAQPLARLDRLLPAEESARVRTHDKVAVEALTCLLAFDQARERPDPPTDDSIRNQLRMSELVGRAERVAASAAVRDRLAENRRILEEAALSLMCWFCRERPGISAAMQIWMHGNVVRVLSRVSWSKVQVTVPRCSSCRNQVLGRGWFAALRCALYFVVAISVPTMLFPGSGGGYIFLAVVVAIVAFVADLVVLGKSAEKERKRLDSFPPLAELRDQGWQRGEKPLGLSDV